ncbi:DUF7282 domain-containing protein [Salinibaculum salinum]|uniref:DUF7282 domain-containing protein n=1 Tax=Salinibaculum salinum TaxID=3131996 RepID=UPI0030EEC0BD
MTVALLVALSAGSTVAFAVSPGQSVQQSSHTADDASGATVTAEEISADQIRMENVEVSNLTVDLSEIQSSDSMLQDSFGSAVGGNVEGFMVDSIEIGSVQNASVSVEDNVATIDAEIESITLVGVSADRVTIDGSMTGDSMARPMLEGGDLTFDSVTVEGLAVGTLTSEKAPAETPTEPETPTPTETETPTEETPTPTPTETETPTEETPTPTPTETETPTEETPTPTPTETETPTEETPTPTPTETETPTPTEPTDGEEDNVTDGAVGGDGDNVTDGEEDDVTDMEEASVTFEDQTSDGMVVNLANFTLPDGGYITIHNDSLLEGDAVGSVIGTSVFIDPGTYEDVNITLFDVPGANFSQSQLTESQTLIAMPHQETGDNVIYDFVATNGTEDVPYTSNGSAVTDAANITVNETAVDGEEEDDNVTVGEEDDNVTVGEEDDNVTAEEDDNVTAEEDDNVTVGEEDDNVTAGEEDDNVTAGEGDNVTAEEDDNVTAEEDDNVTVGEEDDNVTAGEEDDNVTAGEGDNVTAEEVASVTFENQTSDGMVVNVTNFTLPDGGYVAIHNDSLLDGDAVGSVIGASEYFEPGSYENESITLFNVSGANFTEMQLNGSQTLIAMPHQETNENTTYDFVATNGTADGPYLSNESAVTDAANVTVNETAVDGEEDNVTVSEEDDNVTVSEEDDNVTAEEDDNVTAEEDDNVTAEEDDNVTAEEDDNVTVDQEAAVSFESQATNGTTVSIANFTLPDGGYVAIHNDTLLDGDAVGSVIGVSEYFEPGTYENQSVTLFNVSGANFSQAQLTELQTLIAMPHQETNENTTYDFVATNGTADGPYLSNGTAVTDNATVAVEAE